MAYTLDVGEASGITERSTFEIHATKDRKSPVLCEVSVQSNTLTYFDANLILQHSSGNDHVFPEEAYAYRTCTGSDFKLCATNGLLEDVESMKLGKHGNIPVKSLSEDESDVSLIDMGSNTVDFNIHHSRFTGENENDCSCTVHCEVVNPPAYWNPVLGALHGAADFYTYLNFTPPKEAKLPWTPEDGLSLHCHELKECRDRNWVMEKKDGDKDLINRGKLDRICD